MMHGIGMEYGYEQPPPPQPLAKVQDLAQERQREAERRLVEERRRTAKEAEAQMAVRVAEARCAAV